MIRYALLVLIVSFLSLLTACASRPPALKIDTSLSAKGQDSRAMFLVIHYTATDLKESIRLLTEQEVSAHYLVTDQKPVRIYQLVDESRRAWHAGVSYWRGHANLNAASIGIEIVHPGFVDLPQGRTWLPYAPEQIDAVVALVQAIVRRHDIRADRVLGHSDVAPQRKHDPGPLFPWPRLADLGLVAWPDAARVAAQRPLFEQALPDVVWWQKSLSTHGFEVPQNGEFDEATRRVLAAFQMKFRPANFDGLPDAETAALLHVLITPVVPR